MDGKEEVRSLGRRSQHKQDVQTVVAQDPANQRARQSSRTGQVRGATMDHGWNLGGTGRRGRAEMGERPSDGRDAAWSPELPGYLDLLDPSQPFPCIIETIEVAHNHPSDAASHRTRANELRREAGPLDFLPREELDN